MSILIDDKKSVLVQGITGREGRTRASLMKDYGTNIVAGVTPGKGGQEIIGVPVYDTVLEACEACIRRGSWGQTRWGFSPQAKVYWG
jgi:succinyl-CoA synthetase alpha subunit